MIDDPTLVVICILSGWLVFLFSSWYFSKNRPSEGSGLLSLFDAPGELIATILILQWSIFPVILFIARTTITLIDPIILDSVSLQLLVQGFGSSIIIAVVMLVAVIQKKITLSGKANPKILLIETLILLLLIVASVDMALL